MRDASVFLCPSWEEGFGMPGLEAMTCRAGPRYDGHERESRLRDRWKICSRGTPRESDQLAQVIILLLRAPEQREKPVNGALEMADGYPTWSESASWCEKCRVRVVSKGINAL